MGLKDIFGKVLSMGAPLANFIPGVGPLVAAGMGAAGGALANRGGETGRQTTTGHSVSNVNNLNMPEYDPKSQLLRDHMINAYMANLEDDGDYFQGYQKQGLANLGAGTSAATRGIENMLASRGISGAAAGSALAQPLVQGQSSMASFLNSIPQMQDQRRQQILKDTGGFLSSLPVGQRMTGTTTTDSTGQSISSQPGNMWAGALQGGAQMLAGMFGNGAFGKGKQTPGVGGMGWEMPATGLEAGGAGYNYGNLSPQIPQPYRP